MHRSRWVRVKSAVAFMVLLGCAGAAAVPRPVRRASVRPGIDVLLSDSIGAVRGRRLGLVTNVAAVDANGVGDIARLRGAGLQLVALFAPEHGLTETAAPGERVAGGVDSASRLPIYSLYGRTIAPTDSMLAGIDLLLVDLPDVGARYYTYLATTVGVMQSAARHHIPVLVLDRPNPLGGAMQGNILDTAYASMVGRLAVPMRHGLTLGEEARLARSDLGIDVDLRVIPVSGWQRSMLFDATGLPFRAPSPNLRSLDALFLYPGLCLFEGTALSVGRGTEYAFELVGAPWLDTTAVLRILRGRAIAGVTFESVVFTPHVPGDQKFADMTVPGIRVVVTDRVRQDPTATAVEMLAAIRTVHPDRIVIGGSFDRLAGGPALREALLRGDDPRDIVTGWQAGLAKFRARASAIMMYR
jgi:uncharacterized protein YbbC (DUF1343 family)